MRAHFRLCAAFEGNTVNVSKLLWVNISGMFKKKLYYRKLWIRAMKVREPSRVRLIAFRRYVKLISLMSKSSRILDVSCGSGIIARMLESEGHKNLVGIDLVNRFKRGQNTSFIVAENTHLPFQRKSFDVIFARKFVSTPDLEESLKEFYEILKDRGTLAVEIVNVKRLKSRIYESLGLTPTYPPTVLYFPYLHLAPFKKILCQENFVVLRIEGDHVRIPLISHLISFFRLDILQRILGQLSPTLCLHLFAISKKQTAAHRRIAHAN